MPYCGVTSVNRFKIAYERCKNAKLSPAARAGSASGGRVRRRFQPVETVDSPESRVRASAKSRSQPFEVEKNCDLESSKRMIFVKSESFAETPPLFSEITNPYFWPEVLY